MKWHSHAKAAFYAMKGCLELWVMARKSGDNNLMIALTRILYDQVFSSGKPNQTGYISSAAMTNKREKKKTCSDHCLSPQFVARMIFDILMCGYLIMKSSKDCSFYVAKLLLLHHRKIQH